MKPNEATDSVIQSMKALEASENPVNQFLESAPAGYDPTRVRLVGYEYSANGWDVNFSPEPITHKVLWVRPCFKLILSKARPDYNMDREI